MNHPVTASQVWLEYCLDPLRDDDTTRWWNAIDTGDFKRFKRALKDGDTDQIQTYLEQHHDSPEMSCTYANKHNDTRWQHAVDLIIRNTRPGDTIVDIGAGSHAHVINQLLERAPNRYYVICDLTTPLLLSMYNLSKKHRVRYLNPNDDTPHLNLKQQIIKHDCVLIPHHMSYMLYQLKGCTFYNSYSFSEMSAPEIDNYMDIVAVTESRLISENYWDSSQYTTCHLCDTPVLPLKTFVPRSFRLRHEQTPHVPTNPGALITIHDS